MSIPLVAAGILHLDYSDKGKLLVQSRDAQDVSVKPYPVY